MMMDLVEILKDVPRGTRLYSPLFGVVEFIGIIESVDYPIEVRVKNQNQPMRFTRDGRWYNDYFKDAECVLFPSKDQRDWDKFSVIDKATYEDGDVLVCDRRCDGRKAIFLYHKNGKYYGQYLTHCLIDFASGFETNGTLWLNEVRRATTQEREQLFKAIVENGYWWNEYTKRLGTIRFKVGDRIQHALYDLPIATIEMLDYTRYKTDGGWVNYVDEEYWVLVKNYKIEQIKGQPIYWFKVCDDMGKTKCLMDELKRIVGFNEEPITRQGYICLNEHDGIVCVSANAKLARMAMMVGNELKIKDE